MSETSVQETVATEGYCVKCRDKRHFTGVVFESVKGARMAKGPCPVCGTTVCRTMGRKATS